MPVDQVFKSGHQDKENPLQFVLSDESVDRMGDVIRADGWDLTAFKRNPVALFGHSHDAIVGVWTDVKVVGKKLLGTLKLAAPGTSQLVDTTRALIEQKILKAVSVGFQPIDAKPRKDGGWEYTRSALHEVSLVAVPANSNALAIAKCLSPSVAEIVFAKSGVSRTDNGQSTHLLTTPRLDAARQRLKSMGIDY
jgi:HK97 family phage prohead protease